MPRKSFKVTKRHTGFCRDFVNSGNISQSALKNGFSEAYGYDLVQKPLILSIIVDFQVKAGLTDEILLRTHAELLNNAEANIRLGATRLGYQVKKKIGSDDSLPVGEIPDIHIHLGSDERADKLSFDAAPNISIHTTD